jgi:hypothetical protein
VRESVWRVLFTLSNGNRLEEERPHVSIQVKFSMREYVRVT